MALIEVSLFFVSSEIYYPMVRARNLFLPQKTSFSKPNTFCGRNLTGCQTLLIFGYMNLKNLWGHKKLALGRVGSPESYHVLDVYCNSAVQVLVIVRLGHVSVRELNSGAISKSCPGDVGWRKGMIPCGASGTRLHARRGGSRCLILRQSEYNISHRNVLPFLSSYLVSCVQSSLSL